MTTSDIALVVSVLSLTMALIFNLIGDRRKTRSDDQQAAGQMTTVIVKLESIGSDLRELKNDIKDVRAESRDNAERLARLEQRTLALEKNVYKGDPK